ncbi:MAG: DUF3617 domain-containing protein [Sphingosinicella sp.]|uniref:DUF3617 domain-containing protein n=1 Tax=Sphingosinicella sp. TaxID=1917971 RepID=UPI004038261C
MRKTTSAIAMLLLAACGGQSGNEQAAASGEGKSSASVALQPGQYETTVEVTRVAMANMPNMPAGMTPPPPPTTVRSCLTPEQAARPNANFLSGSGDTGGCEYSNFSMDGGRMRGTVQCDSEGSTMRSTFDGRISGDGYQMTSQAQVTASGMTMEMDTRTTARRIGDCPAG